MSMEVKNIKRNSLDYILTDILPVELSEQFTFRQYYEYLQLNRKTIDNEIKKIIEIKNKTNSKEKLFDSGDIWKSMPLKFNTMKGETTTRELNVVNPMAALEIHYFIEAYQKEILSILENNNVFSLRTHRKTNNLYYKSRKKNIIQYFSQISENINKGVLEQTGSYFDLKPYTSMISFTNSDTWYDLNLRFKYFARIDYKSCFDSIYTHTYKWLISKDVNDSINFKNTNLYTTIDKIMQNINAGTSNGIIVGPEFSRMIAEILLQGIDIIVYSTLVNNNYKCGVNFSIYRYVDDIFIFSESEELLDIIIKFYDESSQYFLLRMNEMKIKKEKLPFILSDWLNEAGKYATNLSDSIFYNENEQKITEGIDTIPHIFKGRNFYHAKSSLKRNFNDLICKYNNERQKIVSYTLGTILKKISSAKTNGKYTIFRVTVTDNMIFDFLDYIFYVFSHFPSFENTQRMLSIVSYINDEVDLKIERRIVLQKITSKYSYIFEKGNPNDLVNLVLLCAEFGTEIVYHYEKMLKQKIYDTQNPITMATYLVYSKYNEEFFIETKTFVDEIIAEKMDAIRNRKNVLLYKEFWWLLIFNKCPYISQRNQDTFDEIIDEIIVSSIGNEIGKKTLNLFSTYLKNHPEQFFMWDISNKNMLKQITYRTYERTIFKNYKFGQSGYSSIE